jgi:hypothetical protein
VDAGVSKGTILLEVKLLAEMGACFFAARIMVRAGRNMPWQTTIRYMGSVFKADHWD